MAAVRSKAQSPVGSAQWITDENEQISLFGIQEAEDFAFSARNEVEWLNEHMAEIFSKNQLDVTEIFKTPGKLRGKTPRTARKRNRLEVREPLTDVFSTNARPHPSPSKESAFGKEIARFQVAEDPKPLVLAKPSNANTDSGYHGMTEDEMDMDDPAGLTQTVAKSQNLEANLSPPKPPVHAQKNPSRRSEERSTTDGSFQTAKEDISSRETCKADLQSRAKSNGVGETEISDQPIPGSLSTSVVLENPIAPEDAMDLDEADRDSVLDDAPVDESRSPSEGSSPAKPLVRKSSLTFAALPAREPLTTKKSIGSRVSRTSHLDQTKATLNRGSFLGRFTGGKSLGGLRQPEPVQVNNNNDEMDADEAHRPELTREESDGDMKMAKLHSKSSTQRLHDKINMLGKSQPARPTKSIPAAVALPNPGYPELPQTDTRGQACAIVPAAAAKAHTVNVPEDDDDDWIRPPQKQSNDSNRPKLSKSTSVDVMEDIRGKHNISDQDFGFERHGKEQNRELSPLRQSVMVHTQQSGLRRSQSASKSISASPARAGLRSETNHVQAHDSNLGREQSPNQSTTPNGTPTKRYVDGPLSASKSKLQSIMKTARGLFTSSAGVSAQAKMETLSPHSMRTRGQLEGSRNGGDKDSKLKPVVSDGELYPDFRSSKQIQSTAAQQSLNLANHPEPRKTRSSTEKEEKRKEKEVRELHLAESELEHSRRIQNQKAVAPQHTNANKASADVRTMELEAIAQSNAAQPTKPTRQSPRRLQNQQEAKQLTESSESSVNAIADDAGSAQVMGPPPPIHQTQPSQLQRPKDVRRPIKPAKEVAPKPKPQPVAIRVGTLSQRIPLTNAALSSGLQESLPASQPKPSNLSKKPSNTSIHTTASNGSLKSSVTATTTKPKALLAAERKKEQDEKELQRKAEQKREIERKRAAQQEELRRQEQLQRQEAERQRERERSAAIDDPKKIAQKQAIEKRRLDLEKKNQQRAPHRSGNDIEKSQAPTATYRQELGGARPPSRMHTVQDPSRPGPSHPAPNPARPPIKRVFEPEVDAEPVRPRMQGGPNYQQVDGKRRRTEDEEMQEAIIRPTMAPPIRQSNIRKDAVKSSVFSNNHPTAPPHATSSLHKTTTVNQAYQQHQPPSQPTRPNDMAKYTTAKIPFADAPNPPPPSHKTPMHPKSHHPQPHAKSSPHFPNGENIHLDDIPTDSETDTSSPETAKQAKKAMLPDWVRSPNLNEILRRQEELADADEVFGPPAAVDMEGMFRERHHRFRQRTSSANWNGGDRLTEDEVRRDVEGRERVRREGGWVWGV